MVSICDYAFMGHKSWSVFYPIFNKPVKTNWLKRLYFSSVTHSINGIILYEPFLLTFLTSRGWGYFPQQPLSPTLQIPTGCLRIQFSSSGKLVSDSMHFRAQSHKPQVVTCLYYSILYKGLEHPWIWVATEVSEPVPCGYQGTIVLLTK